MLKFKVFYPKTIIRLVRINVLLVRFKLKHGMLANLKPEFTNILAKKYFHSKHFTLKATVFATC